VLAGTVDRKQVSHRDDAGIIDTSTLRLREATVTTGVWLTYLIGGLGVTYVALTWDRPNRPLLGVVFGLAVVSSIVISLLPRERIVRSRYREHFFLTWSLLDLALIVLATVADGGTKSPLVLILVIPVVFSSMSYPLGSVVAMGALSVLTYLALALTTGGSSWSYEASFVVVLACTSVMSAWQAHNHNCQREELAKVSRADPLTGCLNRRGFQERAMAEIQAAVRQSRQGAVMVLDLDNFKPVNDNLGHAAGDELLRWVVRTLERLVRPGDAVGRLGGDEFAVLFVEIEPNDAHRSAERIKQALSERAPSSIGLAMFPSDGIDLEHLTRRADTRLYESRRGRQPAEAPASAWPDVTAALVPGDGGVS
jgi:diguanylate cyclase (GGDEF)-like protein